MLDRFHPAIRSWFRERVGEPTDIQARAWPVIAEGRHVLLTAPTGSGKTLTAFLWALHRFAAGEVPPGATRVLYVSPLKALNNDIRRNLLGPLEELKDRFGSEGLAFPDVSVQVRSGDTPASERRRMLRRPPEILITTPESLNLLLVSASGRESLRGLGTVILDEVHAVAGSKRGVHLITAVDRLVPLAGEFQRIALSATIRPLPRVAAWVAGFRREDGGYVPRPIDIVESKVPKAYELRVRYPMKEDGRPSPPRGASPAADPASSVPAPAVRAGVPPGAAAPASAPIPGEDPLEPETSIWESMAGEIKTLVSQARSTLVFANNRRLSERLARLLNEGEPRPIAYAHHGSLSREIRSVVEARMKEGRLPAIVATSSLELGIDVGALDQVVLVETPASVAAGLQRLGRAGHGVGQTSRGTLFASHGRDLLDAAVAVRCIAEGDIEEVRLPENPLDLLAQVMVSMAAAEEWGVDALYDTLRTSHPFRNLPRRQFDLVLDMLAGRYAEARVRELRPRLAVDAVDRKVRALKGAALAVSLSGGTIPDRGYFTLRHAGSRAKIGELDEEFVWERREGELFSLGSQSWRITAIGANDVEVVPAERAALMAPFWRAEARDRDPHFSLRLAEFLEEADARLADPAFARSLREERRLDPAAAEALLSYLARQRAATSSPLPHRHHLLVEDAGEAPGRQGRHVILHAVWGGRLTRPWSYALSAAWEQRHGVPLEIVQDDDALLVRLPEGEPAAGLLDLVHAGNLEDLLRRALQRTGFFAARFRENAARALLLPRSTPRSRVPLWLNRIRSRNLLGAVSGFGDFPIVLETWRECLRDEFALDDLKARLEEVQSGVIRVRESRTAKPSPFAEGLMWKQTNQFMYETDRAPSREGAGAAGAGRPGAPGREGIRPDLLREIAFSSPLRPRIPREVIAAFEAKAQRLAPGYAPQGWAELVEWAKERLLIPRAEWERLLPLAVLEAGPAAGPDRETGPGYPGSYAASRLVGIRLPGAGDAAVAAVDALPRILRALDLGPDDADLSSPWDPGAPPAPEARAALDRLLREAAPKPLREAETIMAAEAGTEPDVDSEDLRNAGPESEASTPSPGLDAADLLPGLLLQFLRAYGPVTPEFLRSVFGAAFPLAEEALGRLAESEKVIADLLSEDAPGTEICEAANVEILLRLMRRRSRPALRALPPEKLPLFSAAWHGLVGPGRDVRGVQEALDRLMGLPAPAGAWESDILPARVMPYHTPLLDQVFRDSDLLWIGAGKERVAFAFPEDLELYLPPSPEAAGAGGAGNETPVGSAGAERRDGADRGGASSEAAAGRAREARDQVLDQLRRAAPARLDFQALAARIPLPSDAISAALWDLAWEGRITNDTFAALRRGVETGFRSEVSPAPASRDPSASRPSRRGAFQRWKAARPLAGSWLALEPGAEADPLEREELAKERARQALRRHGVVFREMLAHELPPLQWPRLFRALRLMELSGEVLSGRFFDGVPGLQFLAPSALPLLEDGLPEEALYWMSAQDPASPCGLGLEGLPYALPPRASGIHLVFRGSEPIVTSRRSGRDLLVRVPPRHPYLAGCLGALRHLVERAFQPARVLEVETVNGVGAVGSPYAADLLDAGFERGLKAMSLRRGYPGRSEQP